MGHKGKHSYEDKVPRQERFPQEAGGVVIETTAKPVESQTGEGFPIPQRKRRYGEFSHDSSKKKGE